MSMADLVAIGVETLRIDSGCSLEKKFTQLIYKRIKREKEISARLKNSFHGRRRDIAEREGWRTN